MRAKAKLVANVIGIVVGVPVVYFFTRMIDVALGAEQPSEVFRWATVETTQAIT